LRVGCHYEKAKIFPPPEGGKAETSKKPKSYLHKIPDSAEYQVKFHNNEKLFPILVEGLCSAFDDLPLDGREVILSVIPAEPNPNKISRKLSQELALKKGIRFVDATLNCPKASFKNLSIEQKIPEWEKLFNDERCVTLADSVTDKNIIIIDDLYQSGVTMWSYAKYLKDKGASFVLGLVCVKSLRDSDNQ